MIVYKDTSFNNTKFVNLKDSLNIIYKNRNISYNVQKKEFSVGYNDILRNLDVYIDIYFKISEDDIYLEEVRIECANELISKSDLEIYYLKEIFKPLKNFEEEKESNYVIRVYKALETNIGLKGEYTVNFDGTKILFKNLFEERYNFNVLTERIIVFDCKVKANTLNKARSKALNKVREFTFFLSVILDIGFFDLNNKYLHIARLIKGPTGLALSGEYRPTGFIDSELEIVVRNNLDQLQPISTLSPDNDISMAFMMSNNKFYANQIDTEKDFELENIFKERKFPTVNMKNNDYSDDIDENVNINAQVKVPKNINIYYKNIAQLDKKVKKLFLNSCKLYNISSTYGLFEPTMQLAYLVAAVDCLIRADYALNNINVNKKKKKEKFSYSEFVKLYLGTDYDKEICDFLYNYARNGHFHSGESYFLEDEIDLDLCFNNNFVSLLDKHRNGKKLLRKVFIRWISKNIINKESRDKVIALKEYGLDNNIIAQNLNISEEFLEMLL